MASYFCFLLHQIPYLLLAWAYAAIENGSLTSFWIALGSLYGVRIFFSFIDMIGGVLAWNFCGRKIAVENWLQMFRLNGFPKRMYQHDDLSMYLSRIEDEQEQEVSLSVKMLAKQLEIILEVYEKQGVLIGMRMYSSTQAALDIYSPKHEAVDFFALKYGS